MDNVRSETFTRRDRPITKETSGSAPGPVRPIKKFFRGLSAGINEYAGFFSGPEPGPRFQGLATGTFGKDRPAFRVGRHWRFKKDSIEEWVEKQGNAHK